MEVSIIKGFALGDDGDVVIKNNEIQMVQGNDLLLQTAQQVLNTNKGEWFANHDEGITFSNILGKNKTEDAIKYELLQGLQQVDRTFTITLFELTQIDGRKYKVKVTAQNSTGSEISLETTYG